MMGSANITLKEIIKRKISFTKEDLELYDPADFDDEDPFSMSYAVVKAQFDGEIRAYSEMLTELENDMPEEIFLEHFIEKLEECEEIFRSGRMAENVIDIKSRKKKSEIELAELGGYSSALAKILDLFVPIYTDEDFE